MIFTIFENNQEGNAPKGPPWELMKDDEESLAFALYNDLVQYENHYNILQNKYKGLATTWLIATFIGIGYILSGYEVGLSVNIFLALMLLCLLSSLGIFLLWFVDIGVYYKFIESIFLEALKLEKKYPVLGSSHQNILKLHEIAHDPVMFQGIFYSSFMIFLLSMAFLSLSIYLYQINLWFFIIVLFFMSIGWILFILIHSRVSHNPKNKK